MPQEVVHVFLSTGRFQSRAELRAYIDKTYDADGNGIPSAFIREVELTAYEPNCIEVIFEDHPQPVRTLLDGASYYESWLSSVDASLVADSAILVFPPNRIAAPASASITYCGTFPLER